MNPPPELRRYARQVVLPEVGPAGQARLANAHVLLVGAGGLGSPVAMYLAAAGIGTLTVADGDRVQESNLHRQLLYTSEDVGRGKAEAAAARIAAINPQVRVQPVPRHLGAADVLPLVRAADMVVDGSDNFPTRYLLSDACVLEQKALLLGSVSRFEGQVTMLVADDAPCYRCLFPQPPAPGTVPNCEEAGVLGVLPGMIGMAQATAVLTRILGVGESLAGRLMLLDGRALRWQEVAVARDPNCQACGAAATLSALGDLPGLDTESCEPAQAHQEELTVAEAHDRISRGWNPVLLDVREPWEWQVSRLPGASLVPLSSFATGQDTLDRGAEYLVYCHHGVRSASAAAWMRAHGFTRVVNLAGGIDAWSTDVDPSVPRY